MTDYLLSTEDGNTLTTEGEVELLLFESSASLAYRLNVDWDGDGAVDEDSEAFWMLRYAVDRGRDTIIEPSGGGFTPQEIGKLYLTLDNSDGRYDPWNTDSPLYPNVKPGKLIKFTVNDMSSSDYTSYALFTGFISDIQMSGRNDTVSIVAEDMWRLFSEGKLYSKYLDGTGDMTPTAYFHGYIDAILTGMGYSYGTTVTTDTIYDGLAQPFFADNLSIKKEVENITGASLGRAAILGDGTFKYRPLTTTDPIELTVTGDEVLKDIFIPTPWANTRDKIVLNAIGRVNYEVSSTDTYIYSLSSPIMIASEATYELKVNHRFDGESAIFSGVFQDLSAYSSTSGGSDVTSDVTPTYEYYNKYSIASLQNTSTDTVYIMSLNLSGNAVIDNPYDIEFLYTTDSNNAFVLKSPWIASYQYQTTDTGVLTNLTGAGGMDTQKQLDYIQDNGNTLLNHLKTPKAYPTIQMQGRYPDQIQLDIEDTVQLTLTALGIDDTYRVHKVSHEAEGNCQDVLSTFKLYPIMTRST